MRRSAQQCCPKGNEKRLTSSGAAKSLLCWPQRLLVWALISTILLMYITMLLPETSVTMYKKLDELQENPVWSVMQLLIITTMTLVLCSDCLACRKLSSIRSILFYREFTTLLKIRRKSVVFWFPRSHSHISSQERMRTTMKISKLIS